MKWSPPIFDKAIVTLLLMTVLLVYAPTAMGQLSGTYTIGGASPNYSSFNAAVSALESSGVNGPVVFNVRSGTYNETFTLDVIPGVSSTNTVTFQSETGVNTDVTLFHATTTTFVVDLNGADYVTFQNMTVSYTGSSTYGAFRLRNKADYNTIRNCIMNAGSSTSTLNTYAHILANQTTATTKIEHLIIENNTFNGGANSLYFLSGSLAISDEVVFRGNTVNNSYRRGVYVGYAQNVAILDNYINVGTGANSSYTAIETPNVASPAITGNNVEMQSGKYGIALNSSNGVSGTPGLVANNMVSVGGSTNAPAGIYINGSDYVNVYFNTVDMQSTSTSLGHAAIYFGSGTIADGSINIVNNNLALSNGGTSQVAVYLASTNTRADIGTIDYNNYYTPGSARVANSSGYLNLADWQSLLSDDANSISIDPLFVSNTDLHTTETALQAGTAITGLTTDIDGDFRQSPPYIGADEIPAPAVGDDAGVSAMVSPSIPPCSGSIPFEVTVTNYGTNTLTSVTINWTINGVPQTPVTATGLSVATTATTNISLGNATLVSNTPYAVVFTTSNPNGASDANSANDSFSPPLFSTSLSGTYTIGGTSPDFSTFTDAVDALQTYGVCGPVVMNVRQGTYTEQLIIGTIQNASATNTITFQADPANSSAAILEYNSQAFANNYVVIFNEASYLRFYNLTIRTTSTGTYRTVLKFDNNNTDIVFDGNIIETTVAPSNSLNYAVVFMENINDTYDNGIVFNNNNILNGSYGLYFEGYIGDYETGNVITNNTITGFYRTGIYAAYQDGILIQGNEVRGSGPFLISADFADFIGYVAITENIFEAAGSGSSQNIAMEMLDCDGSMGNPSLVANNFFIATAPGNTVEGIRFGSSTTYYDFVGNNIYVSGTNASSTSGVYFNGADEIGFYSNNVFCDGPGNCIEYLTTSNQLYSDYNNLAVANGGIAGYFGSDRNSLTDWQTATGLDANSVSIDPAYTALTSPFDLHISESSLAGAGSTYTGITIDIDGDARSNPPTIGADEIGSSTGCVTSIANNVISGGGGYCGNAPAGDLVGSSPTGGDGSFVYQWEVSSDGVNFSFSGNSQNQSYAAITNDTWYRRIVTAGACADTSNGITFEITPEITDNSISGTATYCDEIPAGTLTGSSPSGGTGTYLYQWMESINGTSFTNVPSGGNLVDYVHGVIANSIWYQRVVTSGQCTDTSAQAVLTIKTGYIWSGAVNANWHVPGNWDCGDVPDLTKDVLIPAAAANQPEILVDSIGECKTIILENGSSLIIRSAGRLNVVE